MSAPQESSSAGSTGTGAFAGSSPSTRPHGHPRLSALRPPLGGALSALVYRALSEAANRSSRILAETEGKTADEIQNQLDAVVELIPSLTPGTIVEPHDDPRTNVPRRYIDVLRAEFIAALSMQSFVPDGRELVMVFAAFEEVIRRSESTPTGRFVARLAGTESVNAVVEIAHDMRSPMSSILFLVDTIRRGQSGRVSPIQEKQLGLVYGAALGLSTLVSDLIDAVRGERLVDGRPVPFSMTEVILGVAAIVQPIGEEKQLPLHVTYPQVDGRLGYPSAINRVLLNLTSNALRYTETGSVSIGCIELNETTVEFWVKDSGRGIPDPVLAMLFDGFRPGSVGIRFSSAGLGLAICRTMVEAMGSALKVETSAEKGTRFSFRLDLPVV